MNYLAEPRTQVVGSLELPGDKSISHRALMLSALADDASEISGFLAGEDCLATLRALRALGVVVEQSGSTTVLVHGVGMRGLKGAADALDMGNAGTAMRLFAGLLAGQAFVSTLIGDASLMKRPMERVAEPLRAMGAEIDTTNGRPPVRVGGGRALRGIDYAMPVASAQVKSAILLAGLYAAGQTSVTSPAVCRDHTERMLTSFGVDVATQGLRTTVRPVRRLL
ncbi:MAG: bifunctional prephenate dehydrogenase/3-phosphoshikimate 1-carboxyvinyltransferase, partial [Pseudomonadota bacterium]|nr:bifunctional prephenate dehydrogenase/3-phosphoshikimate 1-carboxyvinyltransferase [Pseudomonadota bacterium]